MAAPKRKPVTNGNLSVLRKRVTTAPKGPGVYRWLNEEGAVLYVGKAKNLRNRLRSYVTKDTAAGPWKQSFLRQIADFEVTVTNTELEALIFETNQIKKLRPKYNVLMKDDKNYVYAKITLKDPFPRVESVRKVKNDSAKYFGPMLSGGELEAMLTMLRSVFPFRTCSMEIVPVEAISDKRVEAISDKRVEAISDKRQAGSHGEEGLPLIASRLPLDVVCKHKDRPTPCLDFHIQKCSAPCDGRRTPEQYFKESIEGVIRFLKGDYESVRPLFEERMKKAVTEKKFELAAQFRDNIAMLKKLQGKPRTSAGRAMRDGQLISDTTGENSDIIAVVVLSGRADVTVMQRRGGKLIGDQFFSLSGNAEDPAGVLEQFLPQYYGDGAEIPEQIIVSEEITEKSVLEEWFSTKKGRKVRILLPERGRKSHLLQLAEKNVREKARQREAKWEAEKRNVESALQELQSALDLPDPTARIEGYDISHLGGTETVGSMSVMIGGKPRSDQYRSFTIRSLKPGTVDDYAALQEVLRRRLKRLTGGLKQEEALWKKQGITIGQARKAEGKTIEKIMKDEPEQLSLENFDPKDFLVVRHGKEIVAFGRLLTHAKNEIEMKSIWVKPSYRKKKLGTFVIRKILQRARKLKLKKVYIRIFLKMEEFYAQLGFRHLNALPPVLGKMVEEIRAKHPGIKGTTMAYIFSEHPETDVSLDARPDLLVIDGGKGQLAAVQEVLANLKLDIPVIGLAKREEQVFMSSRKDPDAAEEIIFAADSPAKFLLMRLRDEAHRFANRHREGRGAKAAQATVLDEIPAIGPETRKKLLQKFGSVSGIREASDAELSDVLSEGQLRELRKKL